MKLNEVFPSKYLKTEDLLDGDITLTIRNVDMEEVKGKEGKDESKPVITFREKAIGAVTVKPVILNKTNWAAIAKLHGDDSDDWLGKQITLTVIDVDAFGETRPAIRVKSTIRANGKTPFVINAPLPESATAVPLKQQWKDLWTASQLAGVKLAPIGGDITPEQLQARIDDARAKIDAVEAEPEETF